MNQYEALRMIHLEDVADAARVLRKRLRQLPENVLLLLWGCGLPESAFTQLSLTLDELNKEGDRSDAARMGNNR